MKVGFLFRTLKNLFLALLFSLVIVPVCAQNEANTTTLSYFTDADAFIRFLNEENFRKPFSGDAEYFNFVATNAKQLKSLTTEQELEINYIIAYQYIARNGTYAAYSYIDRLNTILSDPKNLQLKYGCEALTLEGSYFYSFDRINEAKSALHQATKLTPISYKITIDAYNTLGLIAEKENKLDSTLYFFDKGLKLAKEKNDDAWTGIISGNIGYVQYLKKNYPIAKKLLLNDFKTGLKTRQIESAIGSGTFLVHIALEENNLTIIPSYFKILDSLIHLTRAPTSNMRYYLSKSLYLQQLGNYKEALACQDKYIAYRDTSIKRYNQASLQNTIFQIQFEKQKTKDIYTKEHLKRRSLLYNMVILTLIIILLALFIVFLIWRKSKTRKQKILQLRNENMQMQLDKHCQELKHILKNIMKQNDIIQNLRSEISSRDNGEVSEEVREKLQEQIESLTLITENDLFEFSEMFDKIHPGFVSRMMEQFPDLTSSEIRLAMIIRLKLDRQAAAKILCVTEETVRKANFRLRKKLNINGINELYQFILNF